MAEPKKDRTQEAAADYGEILAAWRYDEFERHKRGKRWYILAAAALILLALFAYFDNNLLLIAIIILAAIIYAVSEYRGAADYEFGITEDGLVIGPAFYPYEDINNFFVIYQPPSVKMLYFDPKSLWRPHIGIPLGDNDPNTIRELLLTYLPEDLEKEDEPLSDFLGRLFKL